MPEVRASNPRPTKPEDRGWNRGQFDKMVSQFGVHRAAIIPDLTDIGAFHYRLIFSFRLELWVTVTVEISLKEWQTDSDLVILTMVTTPEILRSRGYGGKVLGYLADWAKSNNLNEIRATQVSDPRSKRFWIRNGFVKCPAPNPTSDFIKSLIP